MFYDFIQIFKEINMKKINVLTIIPILIAFNSKCSLKDQNPAIMKDINKKLEITKPMHCDNLCMEDFNHCMTECPKHFKENDTSVTPNQTPTGSCSAKCRNQQDNCHKKCPRNPES